MTSKSVEEIVALYRDRQAGAGKVLAGMRAVRDAYNADIVVPLPQLDTSEKAAVANLVQTGLDQTARRIASTTPNVYFPPVDEKKKTSRDRAETRRKATLGWWGNAQMPLKLGQRARYLIGYATSPVVIRPCPKDGVPLWTLRDPLSAFPADMENPTDMTPDDCVFGFVRPYRWIKNNYPTTAARLVPRLGRVKPSDRFDLVEYVDGDEIVLIAAGRQPGNGQPTRPVTIAGGGIELERLDNRAGICTAVVPGRITLDRPMGQFEGMLGIYQTMARLTALELIAVEKGIFPDVYAISRPNEQVRFISGPHKPGSGLINEISGGEIKEVQTPVGYQTNPTIDRLERAARINANFPAEYGGESPTNVRTDRRGTTVMGAVVDPTVQEAQMILAASLQYENKIAVAVAKGYFGDSPKQFYVSWKGVKGQVDYTPNTDFETDNNQVAYSHPGADVNGLAIAGGQRVSLGTLSKRSFMELDPMVDDPEQEHDRFVSEQLEAAMLASITQQASAGQIPPHDVARIMELVGNDRLELAAAVQKVQEEAQQRQSTTVNPTAPGSPAAMPGLAQPGTGAEAGVQPVGPPPPAATNLARILGTLRDPQRTVASERTPVGA